MPLNEEHILKFLDNESDTKAKSELISLLKTRIDKLCFDECERDRITCTLQPKCSRRFLLKLRIKGGLTIDDLPKFCYSVHKGVVERFFRNKTVIYRPFDAYLYIIDFFDIFFHGDYRKLNKFVSFKKWDEIFKIFDDRIQNRNENFDYLLIDNYLIIKFDDRLHIAFLEEKYAICNSNRENIASLELLYGICKLHAALYFSEVKLTYMTSKHVEITLKIPYDVLTKISEEPSIANNSKADQYFWNTFWEDLNALTQYCDQINLNIDKNQNLEIILYISLLTNNFNEVGEKLPLRFRDLRLIFNFITRIYTDYYILWV
ncbi:MAG: hypothetical protein CEE43_17685 [Promethearchaeota archaeon Loki_b32]|nr:MAG: hypothetical protein CEE43_17685 [Candidatus Lokiarchaeota archaeon Loki_b32]